VVIDRYWQRDDRLQVTLPMRLGFSAAPDQPSVQAVTCIYNLLKIRCSGKLSYLWECFSQCIQRFSKDFVAGFRPRQVKGQNKIRTGKESLVYGLREIASGNEKQGRVLNRKVI